MKAPTPSPSLFVLSPQLPRLLSPTLLCFTTPTALAPL
jgi:hypothetical protein